MDHQRSQSINAIQGSAVNCIKDVRSEEPRAMIMMRPMENCQHRMRQTVEAIGPAAQRFSVFRLQFSAFSFQLPVKVYAARHDSWRLTVCQTNICQQAEHRFQFWNVRKMSGDKNLCDSTADRSRLKCGGCQRNSRCKLSYIGAVFLNARYSSSSNQPDSSDLPSIDTAIHCRGSATFLCVCIMSCSCCRCSLCCIRESRCPASDRLRLMLMPMLLLRLLLLLLLLMLLLLIIPWQGIKCENDRPIYIQCTSIQPQQQQQQQ